MNFTVELKSAIFQQASNINRDTLNELGHGGKTHDDIRGVWCSRAQLLSLRVPPQVWVPGIVTPLLLVSKMLVHSGFASSFD